MKENIKRAVADFITCDVDLLDLSAHEQAISHRIAVYLESIYGPKELNVDCEYNKHLGESKRVDLQNINPEEFKTCNCDSCETIVNGNIYEIPRKYFRPDILVHSRGNDERNLIAIEVKKSKECPFDEAKLRALTKPRNAGGEYGYELGVFIWFIKNEPQYKWFVVGAQV